MASRFRIFDLRSQNPRVVPDRICKRIEASVIEQIKTTITCTCLSIFLLPMQVIGAVRRIAQSADTGT